MTDLAPQALIDAAAVLCRLAEAVESHAAQHTFTEHELVFIMATIVGLVHLSDPIPQPLIDAAKQAFNQADTHRVTVSIIDPDDVCAWCGNDIEPGDHSFCPGTNCAAEWAESVTEQPTGRPA